MARSIYSRSPPQRSPSPAFSDSSKDSEDSVSSDHADVGPSLSRPGSPAAGKNKEAAAQPEADTVTCQWEDCGIVFTHLPTLIEHIHNDHIGVHKSNYTCEWSTCSRRGLAQTSRFALISHIRSHTGEKPFTCPRPECDKSFTRSDALAKHMRLQHNISPPLPGRGGNRKRKREATENENEPHQHTPTTGGGTPGPATSNGNGSSNGAASSSAFNTFKVEPNNTPDEGLPNGDSYFHRSASPASEMNDDYDDGTDGIPPHLLRMQDLQTGLIMGRTPDMVRYLVMKAKHDYTLGQHESLIEELRVMRTELRREREEKERVLDYVLRASLGPQADRLIEPIALPERAHHRRPALAQ